MNRLSGTLVLLAASVLPGSIAARAQQAPLALKLDQETPVGSATAVCTGIGQTKHDPRWSAYPLRLEFANDLREHLIDGEVSVADSGGAQLLAVRCPGPWLLLKLPDGASYRVEVRIAGSEAPAQSRLVKVPASGQTREIFVFPGL